MQLKKISQQSCMCKAVQSSELPHLQTCMFNLLSQLHTVVEGGQHVVTQATADVTVM